MTVTMSDADADPSTTLASLTASLTALESAFAPLHSLPWVDTTAALGTLDRAKMDVLAAYAINDLVWGE